MRVRVRVRRCGGSERIARTAPSPMPPPPAPPLLLPPRVPIAHLRQLATTLYPPAPLQPVPQPYRMAPWNPHGRPAPPACMLQQPEFQHTVRTAVETRGTTSWGNVPSLESSLREDEQQIRTDSEPQILQSPKHIGQVPMHHRMRRPQQLGRKGENLVMTPQTQKAEAGLQSEKKPNGNMQHY